MSTITNTAVTREHVWRALRRTQHARRRERYDSILLLMHGRSCPEIAQWLYRDEGPFAAGVYAFNEAGLHELERAPIPRRPT